MPIATTDDGQAGLLARRFVLKRRLGVGSFGIVYEAFDHQRNATVALKQLTRVDPASIWRFKTEFRALADVSHPNLVTLHELFMDEGTWFFTMELVPGEDFFSYLRGPDHNRSMDFDRLRRVLGQLAEAVQACHTAGFIHRDIKPSNALIRRDGRLVLLDFGLLAATDAAGTQARFQGSFTGTPAYMAPELFSGQPASRASDWYSVGVMLFEAITGSNPFEGNAFEALRVKRQDDWSASALAAAPEDLRNLCGQLLQPSPKDRPHYESIARRLGPAAEKGSSSIVLPPFLGRETAMGELRQALESAQTGRMTVVRVHGPSGIGKTTLVQSFLRRLRSETSVVVLEGRCHEHESVPYKAFDVLLDDLVERLSDDEAHLIGELDPTFIGPLAHVFPSFGRLRALDGLALTFDSGEAMDQRDRAFAGLRALLETVARKHTLVMFLDDLQWADRDSVAVLRALFSHEAQWPVLFLASHRDEISDTQGGMLGALIEIGARESIESRDIPVGPLTREESEKLVRALASDSDEANIEAICHESAGHPYFVCELAHAVRSKSSEIAGASLNALITERISRLPPPARHMIEVASIAGRALEMQLLRSGTEPDAGLDAVTVLRRARLVKTHSGATSELVDVYHDRIREAVVLAMPTDRRATVHRVLAEELERSHTGEPEDLMTHWNSCGEVARAARYADLAADRAMRALAFDRAARLYRVALAPLHTGTAKNRSQLLRKLGDALYYAGRGTDSARAYAEAAEGAPYMEGVELRRLAAEQFLRSGQIEEGLRVMKGVLGAVDLTLPATAKRAFASLLVERAFIRLRGLRFRERSADQVAPRELARIDVCWSARTGLSLVDYVLHVAFQSRHLILALRAGEPYRVARALIAESGLLGGSGNEMAGRAEELLDAGRQLAQRLGDPYLIASGLLTKGANELFLGRWQASLEYFDQAERLFREECRGVTWDLSTTHLFTLVDLRYLGRMDELRTRLQAYVDRAEHLGDLYASVSIRLHMGTLIRLAADDVGGAERQLTETRQRWSYGGFQVQHWLGLSGELDSLLYQGKGREALEVIANSERAFQGSFLDRVQVIRIEWTYRRALAALLASDGDPAARRRLVRDAARRIGRERLPWTIPLFHILQAALARREGDRARASRSAQQAIEGFEAANMPLHASVARYRMAALVEGDDRARALSVAAAEMISRGIARPESWSNLYAPSLEGPWS